MNLDGMATQLAEHQTSTSQMHVQLPAWLLLLKNLKQVSHTYTTAFYPPWDSKMSISFRAE